jgi:hypothetical protein
MTWVRSSLHVLWPVRSGVARTVAAAGVRARLAVKGEEVELDPGPVAVVAVVGPDRPGRPGRLTTVVAFQGCDQSQGHEYEEKCGHGSNYALKQFMPRVAFLTWYNKFLPYWRDAEDRGCDAVR